MTSCTTASPSWPLCGVCICRAQSRPVGWHQAAAAASGEGLEKCLSPD